MTDFIARCLPLLVVSCFITHCSTEIGDSCSSNQDCSTTRALICDTSQPDGYCTIEGCDSNSCGDDALCIRFFPIFTSQTKCDPKTEDSVDPSVTATNVCSLSEICLSEGICAAKDSERRFCMASCDDNGDCRSGYECGLTGTRGAERVISFSESESKPQKFCRTAGK